MRAHVALGMLLTVLAGGCSPGEEVYEEPIRAIKTYTVNQVASGRVRRYSGSVAAADRTALSFEVSGNVQKVAVDLGQRVEAGQVLATLDREPYQLDVEGAQAELDKSEARVAERKANYERYKSILHTGAVSRADYERAKASHEASQGEVSFNLSRLNLARRDLSKTVLSAPYDGSIGWKRVEPHMEVLSGQKLFEISAEGGLEVLFNVPETTINQISLAMRSEVTFPTLVDVVVEAVITEIGSIAVEANAYPVVVSLSATPSTIRSGMTAVVNLTIAERGDELSVLVPLAALAAGPEPKTASVFRFDPETSTVQKVLVRGGEGYDNWMAVRHGLEAGDVIAIAGVNYLVDGQKVVLLEP